MYTKSREQNLTDKLKQLYGFLKANRKFNHSLQERYYFSVVRRNTSISSKVLNLLYEIANTQSRPKIDNLSQSFKFFYENRRSLESFVGFVNLVNNGANKLELNYFHLFNGMKKQHGWGNKTAALLVKSVFHMNNDEYSKELRLWNDIPRHIDDSDKLYLPVDTVIISIFNEIDPSEKWNFNKINEKLMKYYSGSEMEVWDDLWFWGFITQKGSGENRLFVWNENKYWMLREAPKNKENIDIIKDKSNNFIEILTK